MRTTDAIPDGNGRGGAMNLGSVMIETDAARAGMLVRELFDACGRAGVQALPFVDENGRVAGRVTLKNVLRVSCLPAHMVQTASLLNSSLSCVENAEEKAREVICTPVEPYVQRLHETLPSGAPLIKALAIMESHDTSYIFVEDDGVYRGMVTIQGIAASMSKLEVCCLPEP